jgi:hypothetical protein
MWWQRRKSAASDLRVRAQRSHPPASPDQCFRDGSPCQPAQRTRAALLRHRRPSVDSELMVPNAHHGILLRHPLGTQALPGGEASPHRAPLALQSRPRRWCPSSRAHLSLAYREAEPQGSQLDGECTGAPRAERAVTDEGILKQSRHGIADITAGTCSVVKIGHSCCSTLSWCDKSERIASLQ